MRMVVAGVALVVSGSLAISGGEAAQGAMYWGGTIKGATYGQDSDPPGNTTVLETFQRDAGKHITFINTGQAWASFDSATMQKAIEIGAIPLVTMGLGPGITLTEVVEGKQDAQIRAWAKKAKEFGYPFLFRPWWEPNGDWYSWGRNPEYVAAWRRFHKLVVEEGATNVTWAWIVNSIWWDPASDPTPYYPGDEYVDWVGTDAYNWGLNPNQPDRWLTPEQTIGPTLNVLEKIAPTKPVCICEDASTEIGGDKPSWVREMLGTYLPHHPNIKAYLWFNWNVEQNGAKWDWPIESSPAAEQAFRDGIQNSEYLSTLPTLTKLQKVPIPPQTVTGEPKSPTTVPPIAAPDGLWTGTLAVSQAASDAREAQVAIDQNGRATVVWDRQEGSVHAVMERRYGPGGVAEGPVNRLSDAGKDAFDPRVAVGADGTATVAWVQYAAAESIIRERRVGPGGTPEAESHALSSAGQSANQVQVAAAPGGSFYVAWERYSGWRTVVQARQIAPSGAPGSFYELSDGNENAVEPHLAVEPDGTVIVVWARYDGSNVVIQERRIDPATWPTSPTRTLSAVERGAVEPQLAMGGDGTSTVTWVRFDGTNQIVQAVRVSPLGVPVGSPTNVSTTGRNAVEPQVDVGPDGTGTIVWQQKDGANFVVHGRRLSPAGSLGTNYELSAAAADAHEPQIDIGPDGSATVVWDRFDGAKTIVQARRIEASGVPQSFTAALSAAGQNSGAPAVAAGPGGFTMVAWRRFDGSNDAVQASAFGLSSASLSPSSRDFGKVPVGAESSSPQSFSIRNDGTAALTISTIDLAGEGAADFVLSGDSACRGTMLPPGSSCAVSVNFRPTVAGSRSAQLRVGTSAASGLMVATLSGFGSPSNRVKVGRPKLNVLAGTAAIPITVPGPGSLRLAGRHVRFPRSTGQGSLEKNIEAGGTVVVLVGARGTTLQRLRRQGRAKVGIAVSYSPVGGDGSSISQAVTLIRRNRR